MPHVPGASINTWNFNQLQVESVLGLIDFDIGIVFEVSQSTCLRYDSIQVYQILIKFSGVSFLTGFISQNRLPDPF
jgi:hypothetical protein